MNMPEVTKCFGMFPPKYACSLISLFGLGSGGVILAGLILYGLVENSAVAHFAENKPVDNTVRKAVLVTLGLTSLLLIVSNALLLVGITFSSPGCVKGAVFVMFGMCIFIIIEAIFAPLSCFFFAKTCLIMKISSPVMVIAILILTAFLEIWLYFMVVAFNLSLEMGA